MLDMKKSGKMMIVWIFVACMLFLVAIAFIEPLKGPTRDSMVALNCSMTDNIFIKPVCFLEKGVVVLFVGGFLIFLLRWLFIKSIEK